MMKAPRFDIAKWLLSLASSGMAILYVLFLEQLR